MCPIAVGNRTVCAAVQGQEALRSFCSGGWLEIIPLYNQAQRPLPLLRARAWRLAPWLQARLRSCRLKAGCVAPPGRSTHTQCRPHLTFQRKSGQKARLHDFSFMSLTHPQSLPGGFVFHLGAVMVFTVHSDGDLKSQAVNELMTGLLERYCIWLCLATSVFSPGPGLQRGT